MTKIRMSLRGVGLKGVGKLVFPILPFPPKLPKDFPGSLVPSLLEPPTV